MKLGPVQGEMTAIASGIEPGAVVVVDGADKLREGAKVELITPESRNVRSSGAATRAARRQEWRRPSKRGNKGG